MKINRPIAMFDQSDSLPPAVIKKLNWNLEKLAATEAHVVLHSTGGAGGEDGTYSSYEDLEDLPSIEGVELIGNSALSDFGLAEMKNTEILSIWNTVFGGN